MYADFIDTFQDSEETHLQCGGICNNQVRILKIGQ